MSDTSSLAIGRVVRVNTPDQPAKYFQIQGFDGQTPLVQRLRPLMMNPDAGQTLDVLA